MWSFHQINLFNLFTADKKKQGSTSVLAFEVAACAHMYTPRIPNQSQNASVSSCLTNLFGPIIRPVVWLRFLTGVKERCPRHPPSSPLVPPSTTADSQQVLLFSSHHHLLRDESLAELNRHTCVTPGDRALSLWSLLLTDGPFFLFLVSVLRSTSWKVHHRAFGGKVYGACTETQVWTWQIVLPSAGSSQLLLWKETRWGRSGVFREQTERSLRHTLMFLSNKVER